MSKRYIEFNGITFGSKNWIDKQDGAGKIYTPYIITEFHPNEVNTSYQQDNFITDGALFSNFRYEARIVSLRGYILPRKGDKIEELRQRLYTKLNGKKSTELVYFDGKKKFFCMAFADAPVCANAVKNSVEFNINFTVPDFFWHDSQKTVIAVGERTKLLKTPFTIPMMFAQRISKATVENENEFEIYPRFTIIAKNITEDGSIYITNHTTSQQIVLSGLAIEDDSQIVVDCKKLTATVNNESIINNFNDFSDFSLVPGLNTLECIDSNGNRETIVSLEYYRPYIGV
jgi:hypothetical protein